MKTIVISGFPGVGKTYAKEQNDKFIIADSDSSKFSWLEDNVRNPDFPANYIEHIKNLIGKVDIILVSSHKVVREALEKNEIPYYLVYPKRELKEEYLNRFRKRGSPEVFVKMLSENWDSFLDELDAETYCKKYMLPKNTYLADFISILKELNASSN